MKIAMLFFFNKKLYLLALILSCAIGFSSYIILSKIDLLSKYESKFILFILIFTLILIPLFFYIIKHFVSFFKERKLKKAGKELHNKLILIFSAVVLTPTLIIVGFSVLIFDTALNGWFNPRISTAISQSVNVANQYMLEHQNAMRGDVLALANILNVNAVKFSSSKVNFNKFLDKYTRKHNLSEAVLIDSSGNVLAFSEFVFEYTYSEIPRKNYEAANFDKIIINKEDNSNKMKAFMKLSQYVDAYLLISRYVDKRVLNAIQNTAIAASDYQFIKLQQFDLEISFVVFFLFLTLVLLLFSLLIGLNLANKLVDPISSLITAAEEVGSGNLDYKITSKDLMNINVKEIKRLGEAFNKMIADLKSSRIDLVLANDQLDKRRKFSELLLSGVYSGVIGLDENLKLNLPNVTAVKLLNISIDKHYGISIIKIVPEFSNLINILNETKADVVEDKIEIVREEKHLNLIARIVVQKIDNKIFGYVLTFDDVTNLIAAQKKAAWSDIARRIAHEIKNPLTPIRLASERLKKHLNNPLKLNKEIFEKSLNMITRQVDDIDHLVEEFSSFARMPSPILNKVNIVLVVKQYIDLMNNSFKNISINFDNIDDREIYIMADEKQIRQALGNLIKNSYENLIINKIKNGKIYINLDSDDNHTTLSIEDNGTGIEKKDLTKVIEPYFTTKDGGTGLGLAITNKIIEDHNATMFFKKSNIGQGTIVIIKFPIIIDNI